MRFDGRVALVTGGAHGIGAATARRLAQDGAAVLVADLDGGAAGAVAAEIGDAGGRAVGLAADVTRRDQVEGAVQEAIDRFGRLDILVTCAGILRDNLLFKMGDDDWTAVIQTHLTGAFYAARAAQKPMVEQCYGKMVFLSSISALGNRGQANYAAAKAGLQGFTRTLAIELGPFNVNVNGVAPGFIDTRMTRSTARRLGLDWDRFAAAVASQTPLRRIGRPEDIAGVIAFLCSDDAGFISGETVYVTGGRVAAGG